MDLRAQKPKGGITRRQWVLRPPEKKGGLAPFLWKGHKPLQSVASRPSSCHRLCFPSHPVTALQEPGRARVFVSSTNLLHRPPRMQQRAFFLRVFNRLPPQPTEFRARNYSIVDGGSEGRGPSAGVAGGEGGVCDRGVVVCPRNERTSIGIGRFPKSTSIQPRRKACISSSRFVWPSGV